MRACVCVCARATERACQDDKKMREDRHNSCIMIVTSEPFMIYLCILFVTGVEAFVGAGRNVSLGELQDGWVHGWSQQKTERNQLNSSICQSAAQTAGQPDI